MPNVLYYAVPIGELSANNPQRPPNPTTKRTIIQNRKIGIIYECVFRLTPPFRRIKKRTHS